MEGISALEYKRLAGAKSRSNGEYFERLITAACKYYASENIAIIEKTPEPFSVTKSLGSGKFVGHFSKKAQPDYKGVLNGGRCVIFEAKHTDGDKIAQSKVTAEQSEMLEKHSNQGAKCFVLVSLGFENFYRVPWDIWREMKTLFNHKHMKISELEPYRFPVVNGVLRFLEA